MEGQFNSSRFTVESQPAQVASLHFHAASWAAKLQRGEIYLALLCRRLEMENAHRWKPLQTHTYSYGEMLHPSQIGK